MDVIEIKTGKELLKPHLLQMIAYKKLVEGNLPDLITYELKLDENKHRYTLNGMRLYGVTEIIKPWINTEFYSKKDSEKGVEIHKQCQDYIEKGIITNFNRKFLAFRRFCGEHKLNEKQVIMERILALEKFNIAGRIDMIVIDENPKVEIYNLYLKSNGKFDFKRRTNTKDASWNDFLSARNTYIYFNS